MGLNHSQQRNTRHAGSSPPQVKTLQRLQQAGKLEGNSPARIQPSFFQSPWSLTFTITHERNSDPRREPWFPLCFGFNCQAVVLVSSPAHPLLCSGVSVYEPRSSVRPMRNSNLGPLGTHCVPGAKQSPSTSILRDLTTSFHNRHHVPSHLRDGETELQLTNVVVSSDSNPGLPKCPNHHGRCSRDRLIKGGSKPLIHATKITLTCEYNFKN